MIRRLRNLTQYNFVVLFVANLLVALIGQSAWAQSSGGRAAQLGFLIGRVLPNGVGGDDEIFEQYGARYALPAGSKSGFYDLTFLYADSEGVEWMGVSAGVSAQIPIETLVGHAGLGVDYTRFETSTTSADDAIGVHFIGGVMSRVDGPILIRFDMKLNSKPGTSLLFAFGVVFKMGG